MKHTEDNTDIANVEAWAELLEDLLYLVPEDLRMRVLDLAVEAENEAITERIKLNGRLKIMSAAELMASYSPGHYNTVMRLKGLLIQVFVRDITNNHHPKDAAKMLFSKHPHGNGSQYLGDYLDKLPRRGLP